MTQKRRTFTVRAHSAPSKQNMGHQQNMGHPTKYANKIWDTQKPKGQSPQIVGKLEDQRPSRLISVSIGCWESREDRHEHARSHVLAQRWISGDRRSRYWASLGG